MVYLWTGLTSSVWNLTVSPSYRLCIEGVKELCTFEFFHNVVWFSILLPPWFLTNLSQAFGFHVNRLPRNEHFVRIYSPSTIDIHLFSSCQLFSVLQSGWWLKTKLQKSRKRKKPLKSHKNITCALGFWSRTCTLNSHLFI